MKKIWQIVVFLCVCMVTISSCGDDDEKVDVVWRDRNRTKFLEISANSAYKELKTIGNNGSIYYRVLKEGTGTDTIFYNSQVRTYYTGWMMSEDEDEFSVVFDTHEPPYLDPVDFYANSVIEGWTSALQEMREGDRWEVYIPYQLAYGSSGNSSGTIPGYSTLKFEMEVVKILEQ